MSLPSSSSRSQVLPWQQDPQQQHSWVLLQSWLCLLLHRLLLLVQQLMLMLVRVYNQQQMMKLQVQHVLRTQQLPCSSWQVSLLTWLLLLLLLHKITQQQQEQLLEHLRVPLRVLRGSRAATPPCLHPLQQLLAHLLLLMPTARDMLQQQ